MRFASLSNPCSTCNRTHVEHASGTDEVLEVGWEVDSVPAREAAGEYNVSLRPLGVFQLLLLGEVKEYSYPLPGDPSRVVGHSFSLLGLGESGRVYKSWVDILGGKRGRAARLARGAHNPKVGSSNLPPATFN